LYYLGMQAAYLEEPGESQLIINYCQALTDKINDFMFGSGFSFKGNQDLWPFVEPIISKVWSGTNKILFGLELGQMGSVTGDVYTKVWWDDDIYSPTYGTVQFSTLQSSSVIPLWEPGRAGKDRKMMECRTVQIEEEYLDDAGGEPTKVYYTTVYTPMEIVRYRNSAVISHTENPLGEIPIVHIQNMVLAAEAQGISDIEGIVEIQKEINEKTTSIGQIIDYMGYPLTAAYGIKKGQIEVGPNRILYLPAKTHGAEITNIERNADLRASTEHLAHMKEAAHEMAGVPEASLGKMQPISNTSGVALHMQYQPIVHRTNRKKATYGPGLVELTRLGMKMCQLYDPTVTEGRFSVEIGNAIKGADLRLQQAFPVGMMIQVGVTGDDWRALQLETSWPNILPKDILMELEMARSVMDMQLVPKRNVLKKVIESGALDVPLEEVDELIEAAATEALQQQQLEMYGGMMGGYGGEPITGQNEQGPGSGSAMQAPEETVKGSTKEEDKKSR
jgi:hypothetical protein